MKLAKQYAELNLKKLNVSLKNQLPILSKFAELITQTKSSASAEFLTVAESESHSDAELNDNLN